MSETWRIVLTASVTIGGGVTVYALGRLFVALYVEPIHRLRSLIGEIADSLVFYANVYCNPGSLRQEIMDEASEILRRQASQLRARAYAIPLYSLWAFMRLVQEKRRIEEASKELIGLSNSVYGGVLGNARDNIEKERRIKELLGIQSSPKRQRQRSLINSRMLSHGILLFFFGLILLGLQENPLILFGYTIPIPPIYFYRAFGGVALGISILFIVAIFRKQLSVWLENLLEEPPKSRWQGTIKWLYWVAFLVVYISGWLKGLAGIHIEKIAPEAVFGIGVVWFIVIAIVLLSPLLQRKK
jgi:hypothetical protein